MFDGAMAVLTLHHWADKLQGLKEVNRVLKQGSRLVFFSYAPEQMTGYWLHHYFPKMIETSMQVIPPVNEMQKLLYNSGFNLLQTEKYFVKEDLQDHFLYSHKSRPEMYLLAEVRKNASAFSVLSEPEEVAKGLTELEKDIHSGAIQKIIKDYENDMGDYLFLVAEKTSL
jgi:ubiquinone/menaquinone biosynthesis C-methylase UbiE